MLDAACSDRALLANKTGATRLGFALMLKFFELEGRFPRNSAELPSAAVRYVAEQVAVDAELLAGYDWSGRSIKYHRAQIREALGFREATRADEQRLVDWLADEICPGVLAPERQRDAVLARCRSDIVTSGCSGPAMNAITVAGVGRRNRPVTLANIIGLPTSWICMVRTVWSCRGETVRDAAV